MSSLPTMAEINKARIANGKPPLEIPGIINEPEEPVKPITKTITKKDPVTVEDHKIFHGHINKMALCRYLFPLGAGTFTGAIITLVYGVLPAMVLCFAIVAIVGAVISS
jgi:hypothetical protein